MSGKQSTKVKKNETFTANQITLKQNIIDAVMNLIVQKVEGLVKEAFDSFATDYWKELKTKLSIPLRLTTGKS